MKILKIAILLLLSENIIISMDNKYRPEFDGTDLTTAIRTNNTFLTAYLINNNVDLNKKNNAGYTPLMLSCAYQNIEIIKLLIKNGADLNARNNYDCTALILECEKRDCNIEIINLLINAGTNLNIQPTGTNSYSAINSLLLYDKLRKNKCEIFNLLFYAGAEFDLKKLDLKEEVQKMYDEINKNDCKAIKKIAKSYPYIFRFKDKDDNNFLHFAAKISKPEIFMLILSLNPKLIAQKNKDGLNPLQINPGIANFLFLDYLNKK